MITLMIIHDMQHFLNLVQKSHGNVLLHLPDGSMRNLKEDAAARQQLLLTGIGDEGITLSFTCGADLPRFLQFMMEAAA